MSSLIKKILDHYYRDLINQVNDMETSIRVLVDSPKYIKNDSTGFNGVKSRKLVFSEMLEYYKFVNIIETGSYLGDTTGYLAQTTKQKVYSCEKNERLYSLAKLRLSEIKNIHLYNMDSREFLKHLCKQKNIIDSECFIYLDAHWGKDVPLREEIEIIASNFNKFIIMIDDFKVPFDSGYVHDNYGTLKYINMKNLNMEHKLVPYFPTARSSDEKTSPTGFVILAKDNNFGNILKKTNLLQRYDI